MAFLLGNSFRPKVDLVRPAKDLLPRWREIPPYQKAIDEVPGLLARMKLMLQGTQETESNPEQVAQLVNAIIADDLLLELAETIQLFPFDARKDTQTIFSHVLRYRPGGGSRSLPPAVLYIVHKRPGIIRALCEGYQYQESAMACGTILREALRHEDIAVVILYDEPPKPFKMDNVDENVRSNGEGLFWQFFSWIDRGVFETSIDAFTTFREIVTRHKDLVAHFFNVNFDLFFSRYNSVLMQSSSYVTKRQSIKLLGEILLDRSNYSIMTRYVDSGEHLKICMNLLRDDRRMVQYEGFHVFKVFVANPNKSVPVQKILINNKEKLLKFLPVFLADRTDDEQFRDEKSFLIRQIEVLPSEPVEPHR